MLPGRHPPLINDRNDCFTKHEHPPPPASPESFNLKRRIFKAGALGFFVPLCFLEPFRAVTCMYK